MVMGGSFLTKLLCARKPPQRLNDSTNFAICRKPS